MATAMRSRSKSKSKSPRRLASKSPKKKAASPSDRQVKVEFIPTNCAYADPVDSSRSLLPNVLYHREDQETLTTQVNQLFHTTTIFADEAERSWLLKNMKSTTISVKIDDVTHTINGIYSFKENQPCVLLLHGFGPGGSWANWIKLAYPLGERERFSVIFIDLPGFGQSSGRSLDQTSWKRHGPELVLGVLSSFHIQQPINAVVQCGGAATTVRTINRYPQWYRGRGLVFCNSVIGDFGEKKAGDFENTLTRLNIRVVVYWIPDQDHTTQCIAYKRWNKLRQSGFRHLQLIDLDPEKQTMKLMYPVAHVSNMSRCSAKHKAYVYKLSDEFVQQVIDALHGRFSQ